MTAVHPEVAYADPNRVGHGHGGHGARGHGEGGPAPHRVIVGYGFWIFLLSDIVMFSCFFAAYAVLHKATAGGPTAAQLFDTNTVALETACLLASSFSCGLASLAAYAHYAVKFYAAMAVTFVLGAAFLVLECLEFAHLVSIGAGPQRSAFLSAFFSLVGCHGCHVTVGLLWLLTMMAQVYAKGFRRDMMHRMTCFSLFWHALDIIWIGVFTVVYLLGRDHMTSTDEERFSHPADSERELAGEDIAPGDERLDGTGVAQGARGYVIGFLLAAGLTAASFYFAHSTLVWAPSIPELLIVLAIAQMGVHLVFFLHITTGPDNTNNVLALAFGVLIVFLIIAGSIWIMSNLSTNMPSMNQVMDMQR